MMYAFTVIEQPHPGRVADSVQALLTDARAHLDNAEFHIRSIVRKNARIAGMLSMEVAQLRYQQTRLEQAAGLRETADLGWIVPVIVGVSALVTTIGAWAWKQHKDTEEVEKKVEFYEEMVEQGVDPEEAAELVLGPRSDLSDILSKTVVLAAIIAGVFVYTKLT